MNTRRLLFGVITLCVLGLAGGWFVYRHYQKTATDHDQPVTYSTSTPSEAAIDPKIYQWHGAPDDPKRLIMPSIGTTVFIQKVGVDQHKQVAVPTNIHLAGWFVHSVRPGAKGLSIIDGHVDGRTTPDAAFGNLDHLRAGEQFTVEYGNGDQANFRVKQVRSVGIKEAVSVLFSQDPRIKQQLNLVTCTGTFDRQARLYNQRLVVISEKL